MISLNSLYSLRDLMLESDFTQDDIQDIDRLIEEREMILENTSGGGLGTPSGGGVALANATTAGMGPVRSNQPSAMPGALNGTDWVNGGGKEGSGDISIPYNPSGGNRVFQKMKSPMGKNHGSRTGKKSRKKPLSRKMIQDMLKKKGQKAGKIADFSEFTKKEMNKVTKVKEGKTFQAARNTPGDPTKYDRRDQMRTNVETHVKSFGVDIEHVGNDIEIHIGDEMVAQVMFRDDYVGIKPAGAKWAEEFKYNKFGNIKKKLTEIINK